MYGKNIYGNNIETKLIYSCNLQLVNDLKNNILSIQMLNLNLKTKQQLTDNLIKQYYNNAIWLLNQPF